MTRPESFSAVNKKPIVVLHEMGGRFSDGKSFFRKIPGVEKVSGNSTKKRGTRECAPSPPSRVVRLVDRHRNRNCVADRS